MGEWNSRVTRALLLTLPVSAGWAAGGQGVSMGPSSRLQASLQATAESNDNFYLTESNETEALGLRLRPSLELEVKPSNGEYRFGYKGDAGTYDASDKDDYFDNQFYFTGLYRPLTQHALDMGVSLRNSHDPFGVDRNQGTGFVAGRELDKWRQYDAKAEYVFGGQEATLNLKLRGGVMGKSYYTNERDAQNPATGTRFLDRTEAGGGVGLTYKIGPRTHLLADLDSKSIDYDTDLNPSLDGDLTSLLVGVGWQATAKTRGELRVGQYQRSFDDAARPDGDGFSWKALVAWKPQDYSEYTFETGQLVLESVLQAENFVDYNFIAAGWRHEWTPRFNSNLRVTHYEAEFDGTVRNDTSNAINGLLGYQFSDRYSMEFSVGLQDRDSSINRFDYGRTLIGLSLKADL